MRRLKLLLSLVVLLSPGLILVGLAQDQLTIDASKQSSPPARGRGPFPGSSSPGHSASLPIRLELRISNGPLQPDGTTLVDFVITNIGDDVILLPSSIKEGDGPSSYVLTLWFTSNAIKDVYFKDAASGRPVKIEIVPTSAELYGRSNDPYSYGTSSFIELTGQYFILRAESVRDYFRVPDVPGLPNNFSRRPV